MGTKFKGPAREVLALDAFVKLLRASDSVLARVHRRLDGTGLTVSQFGALEALYHLGPLCQKDLGEKILKSPGNVTMVVGNLARRGLVRRLRAPENRRFVTVSLTAEGRRLVRRLFPGHARAVAEEMGALSAREQAALGAMCRRLGHGGT